MLLTLVGPGCFLSNFHTFLTPYFSIFPQSLPFPSLSTLHLSLPSSPSLSYPPSLPHPFPSLSTFHLLSLTPSLLYLPSISPLLLPVSIYLPSLPHSFPSLSTFHISLTPFLPYLPSISPSPLPFSIYLPFPFLPIPYFLYCLFEL